MNGWQLPDLDRVLDQPSERVAEAEIYEQKRNLDRFLADFGLEGQLREIQRGPRFTSLGLELAPGTKIASLRRLEPDLAIALHGALAYIEEPGPGSPYLRVVVENSQQNSVRLRHVLASAAYRAHPGPLKLGLGLDTTGRAAVIDLAGLPHLMMSGAPGSGKSMTINALLCGLLCTYPPTAMQLVLIDPAAVELQAYGGLPNLFLPLVTRTAQVMDTLDEILEEVETRYQHLERAGARDIGAYNARLSGPGQKPMPYLVMVLDNVADLVMQLPRELEQRLTRMAQKSRAAGVHLILSTVRAQTDTIAGAIKANFPGRIAFKVADATESRLILDEGGAERLLNRGDMLVKTPGVGFLQRVQGAFVSEEEIRRITDFWRNS